MEKNFLWIVSFQVKTFDPDTLEYRIKALSTCTEARSIKAALDWVENRLEGMYEYPDEYVITDIGIAEEASRDLLYTTFPDPINDPDPELFSE